MAALLLDVNGNNLIDSADLALRTYRSSGAISVFRTAPPRCRGGEVRMLGPGADRLPPRVL
jgi:hypothetical protein